MKVILGRRLRSAFRGFKMPEIYESAAVDDRRERERLSALAATGAPLRLHIGCGPRILAGWVNIDLSYQPFENYLAAYGQDFDGPDLRGGREEFFAVDLTRGLPLPDGSVEAVFHEDFLEHLGQKDAIAFLAETRRVLVDGGIHRINTPNLASSMRDNSEFDRGAAGIHAEEWDRWHHMNIFTPSYLEEIALMVGYRRVEFNGRDRSIYPGMVSEFRPGADRPEDGNLFADLVR